jgi:Cell wall-associated hydrolases (invasion-associated proteins)
VSERRVLPFFLALLFLLSPSKGQVDERALAEWFLEVGKRFSGIPYLLGGNGYGGFDCSGLVVYLHRHLGVNLPRTSQEQYAYLPPVRVTVRAGDLLFFSSSGKKVDHVAIYIGGGLMLHASGRRGQVVVEPWTALRPIYVGARRVFRYEKACTASPPPSTRTP